METWVDSSQSFLTLTLYFPFNISDKGKSLGYCSIFFIAKVDILDAYSFVRSYSYHIVDLIMVWNEIFHMK